MLLLNLSVTVYYNLQVILFEQGWLCHLSTVTVYGHTHSSSTTVLNFYCYYPLKFFLSSLASKKPPAPGWSCLESIYLVSACKYKQLSITLTSIQNSNCLLLSSLSRQLRRSSLVARPRLGCKQHICKQLHAMCDIEIFLLFQIVY